MEILHKILNERELRKELIKEFQNAIWNAPEEDTSATGEILSELAYDLDFYEPDQKLRAEDTSFYGDERLVEEIKSVLHKLYVIEGQKSNQ